jgi:hypothetical protein
LIVTKKATKCNVLKIKQRNKIYIVFFSLACTDDTTGHAEITQQVLGTTLTCLEAKDLDLCGIAYEWCTSTCDMCDFKTPVERNFLFCDFLHQEDN